MTADIDFDDPPSDGGTDGGPAVACDGAEAARDRLFEAALDLVTTKGYANVDVEQLAEHAGVSHADLVELFPTKTDLMKYSCDRVLTDNVNAILTAVDNTPVSFLEQLYAGMAAYIHSMLDDPRRMLLVGVQARGIDVVFESERRDALHLFADVIEQMAVTFQDRGEIEVGLPRLTYGGIVAGIFDMTTEWALMAPEERPSLDALIAEGSRFLKGVALSRRL